MFQNEFDFDETHTVILDDTAVHEDVEVFIVDNEVFIRQWNVHTEEYETICMSHKMYQELHLAFKHPEGFFRTE